MSELLKQAEAAEAEQDYEQAEKCYAELLEHEPDHAHAFALRGHLHNRWENFKLAEGCFKEAIKLGDKEASTFQGLAKSHHEQGYLKQALNAYEQALEQQPDLTDASIQAGKTALVLKAYEKARHYIVKARQLAPDNPDTNLAASLLFWHEGKPQAALEGIYGITQQTPDHIEAYIELARLLRIHKQYEDAQKVLKHLLSIAPEHHQGHLQFGFLFYCTGHNDWARAAFNTALKKRPFCKEAYVGLALCAEQKNEWDRAYKNWQLAYYFCPQDTSLYFPFAQACIQQKAWHKAYGLLCAHLQEQPQHEKAQLLIATTEHMKTAHTSNWESLETHL